jgi:hypothetical protein
MRSTGWRTVCGIVRLAVFVIRWRIRAGLRVSGSAIIIDAAAAARAKGDSAFVTVYQAILVAIPRFILLFAFPSLSLYLHGIEVERGKY